MIFAVKWPYLCHVFLLCLQHRALANLVDRTQLTLADTINFNLLLAEVRVVHTGQGSNPGPHVLRQQLLVQTFLPTLVLGLKRHE